MIKLSQLAENINSMLNDKLIANPLHAGRAHYQFYVVADTTDYKKPEREGNSVTLYIQGVLHQIDSNIEASQGGKISATLNTRMDLLLPVFDGDDNEGNKDLVKSVREILDACFSASGAGVVTDDGEIDYAYSYKYSLANTGTRAQLPMIGDSFVFTAYINYYFVEDGINSQKIKLQVSGGDVAYTALGINRSTTQEANLPADSTNGSAQNTNASTQLAINFVAPARASGGAYQAVLNYLLYGEAGPFPVVLFVNGATVRKDMYINEASMNSETVLNASVSATLSEALKE